MKGKGRDRQSDGWTHGQIPFTNIYAEKPLRKSGLQYTRKWTEKPSYTAKLLDRGILHIGALTQSSFCTQNLLHSLYTEQLIRTEAFTQRSQYIQKL